MLCSQNFRFLSHEYKNNEKSVKNTTVWLNFVYLYYDERLACWCLGKQDGLYMILLHYHFEIKCSKNSED